MRLQRRIFAGLGLTLLLALSVSAQANNTTTTKDDPITTTQQVITTTTNPIVTTTKPPVATTTAQATTQPRPTSSATVPRPITTSQSQQPTASAGPAPVPGGPCSSTNHCPNNQICAWENDSPAAKAICKDIPQEICAPLVPQVCTTNADCTEVSYSLCTPEGNSTRRVCAGLGTSGDATKCDSNIKPEKQGGGTSTSKILMYAGIGVGCVAALAVIFSLVRWQRRRKRSRMPTSMFGDIDYGMSDRHAAPLPPSSNTNTGGGGDDGVNQYPFSDRPNAQGNDNYGDQYYDDGYAQNMHPMTGMAGGKGGDAGYYDQGYNNNHYDPNYDQGYYNQGYNQGGYDQAGYNQGYNNNQGGFYDDAYANQASGGYNNYDPKSPGGPASHTSPIAAPRGAHLSPHQGYNDQYGVEPSELDFGGHNNNGGAHTQGGGQGYGRY